MTSAPKSSFVYLRPQKNLIRITRHRLCINAHNGNLTNETDLIKRLKSGDKEVLSQCAETERV